MAINEQTLLNSGFTQKDVIKLNKYQRNNELTLNSVIIDLSKRFQSALLLTTGLLLIYIITLFIASQENIISMGIALLIALAITWFFQSPVLAWKSWQFHKKQR
jgi:hypothetical protein